MNLGLLPFISSFFLSVSLRYKSVLRNPVFRVYQRHLARLPYGNKRMCKFGVQTNLHGFAYAPRFFSKSSFEMIYFESFVNALDAEATNFMINSAFIN